MKFDDDLKIVMKEFNFDLDASPTVYFRYVGGTDNSSVSTTVTTQATLKTQTTATTG